MQLKLAIVAMLSLMILLQTHGRQSPLNYTAPSGQTVGHTKIYQEYNFNKKETHKGRTNAKKGQQKHARKKNLTEMGLGFLNRAMSLAQSLHQKCFTPLCCCFLAL